MGTQVRRTCVRGAGGTSRLGTASGAALLGLALFLAAAVSANASTAATPTQGGTLRIALRQEPVTLDPSFTLDSYSAFVVDQIFDPLVTYDEEGNIVPRLATSWSNPKPTVWEFKIRRGVRFHNGRELTVDDVVWSMNRMLDPNVKVPRRYLYMVERVERVDASTVRFVLKEPFTPFLSAMAHPALSVMPKEVVTEMGPERFARNPVGTGPFRFVSWKPQQGITLARNPSYFFGSPNLERVEFRFIPETSVAQQILETGDVDVIQEVLPDSIGRLQKAGLLQVTPGFAYYYFALNMHPEKTSLYRKFGKNPLTDVRVRKALAMALDVNAITNTLYPGLSADLRAYGPVSPSSWAWDRTARYALPAYNPEEARRLLKEAGYPDGFEVEILAINDLPRRTMAEVAQFYWEKIGVRARIVAPEFGVLLQRANDQDFDIGAFGWGGTAEPHDTVFPLLHSSRRGPGGNNAWYSNSQVDAWIEEAARTSDQGRRRELYRKVLEQVVADLPHIPVIWKPEFLGVARRVHGLRIDPRGYFRLVTANANVWVDP